MNDQPMFDVISGMFGLISGMFGLISGMFGLNRSSIEPGIRYSCYPLVVVFNILSWYRFHCRGMTKHLLLAVEMSKKCTPLWREAHLEVKMLKTLGVRTTLGGSDVVSHGRRKGLCTLSKVSKT